MKEILQIRGTRNKGPKECFHCVILHFYPEWLNQEKSQYIFEQSAAVRTTFFVSLEKKNSNLKTKPNQTKSKQSKSEEIE